MNAALHAAHCLLSGMDTEAVRLQEGCRTTKRYVAMTNCLDANIPPPVSQHPARPGAQLCRNLAPNYGGFTQPRRVAVATTTWKTHGRLIITFRLAAWRKWGRGTWGTEVMKMNYGNYCHGLKGSQSTHTDLHYIRWLTLAQCRKTLSQP